MTCPKCSSENVSIQIKQDFKLKKKARHGVLYWLLVGWWLQPLLWLFLTLPMIIIAIFRPKRHKLKVKESKVALCQNCGNQWAV